MTARPAKTGSLTSRVSLRLRRAIIDAEFGFGELLSEEKLAAALGISRTPVRDALTALQAQGLIEIRPHYGSFVFLPSREDVSDLYEFRAILELQALKMSAHLRRSKVIGLLSEANDAMEAGKESGDLLSVARADTRFHRAIVENSGNHCLLESYDLISGKLDSIRTRISIALGDIRNRAINEHQAIIAALDSNNVSRARTILSSHILKSLAWFDLACKEGLLTTPHRLVEQPYAQLQLDKE